MAHRPVLPPAADTAVFAIFMVAAALLGREYPDVAYPDILWAFLGLLLGNFLTLSLFPKTLAEGRRMAVATSLNILWLTLILHYSGGARSYFWVLYLLPVFHGCLSLTPSRTLAAATAVIAALTIFHRDSLLGGIWGEVMSWLAKVLTIGLSALVVHRVAFRERATRAHLEREQREYERERLRTRERLQHMDRLATLGTLSAAVAHEINTPLAAILGTIEFARLGPPPNPKMAEALSKIESAARRCVAIVRQRLNFARSAPGDREPCDVNALVRECLQLKRHDWMLEGIAIEEDLDEALSRLRLRGPQIQQVLFNLLTNAQQALLGSKTAKPRVRVSTRARDGGADITVADNGPGIPPALREKIWEAFFTTKGQMGTGLGLAICRQIIEDHDGRLTLEALDRGASFAIFLPARTP